MWTLLVPAVHQIVFRKQLAKEMMYNELTETGGIRHSPIRAIKRSRESLGMEHKLDEADVHWGLGSNRQKLQESKHRVYEAKKLFMLQED